MTWLLPDRLGRGTHRSGSRAEHGTTPTVGARTDYDPFGVPEAGTGLVAPTDYGFTGEPQDAGTGTVDLRARRYAPGEGRFLSRDPWAGDPATPQTLNPYAYARNDPVNGTDPTGQCLAPSAGGAQAAFVCDGMIILTGAAAGAASVPAGAPASPTVPAIDPDEVAVQVVSAVTGLSPTTVRAIGTFCDLAFRAGVSVITQPRAQQTQGQQGQQQSQPSPSPSGSAGPGWDPFPRPTATPEDAWVYFIHRTSSALWQGSTVVDAGGGDFGAGFYTFQDTPWGRDAASNWARVKADRGGQAQLVRLRMRRPVFASLVREDVSDAALDTAYQLYYQYGLTGKELIVGPVGKNGEVGGKKARIPDRTLPLQFKFEGSGIAKLEFDSIIQLK